MRRYSLSLVLALLFLVSWVGQSWFGWQEFVAEETSHGLHATHRDYAVSWARATLENWQSEFLQLLSFVILSAFLLHIGSPQSKDGSERMERKIDQLTQDVAEIRGRSTTEGET